jgi:hypothetical protein
MKLNYQGKILKSILLTIAFIVGISFISNAQKKSISILFIDNNDFKIDGVLDEGAWMKAVTSSDFWQKYPDDTEAAEYQTEIKMLYNDKYLYVGVKAYSGSDKYVVPSLERDFSTNADYIHLMFGTYGDRINAFLFGINPYGVQKEGLISGGGIGGGLDLSWDVKWKSAVKIYDGYYIAEMQIPMTSFKFKENTTEWKFNCSRRNVAANTEDVWSKVPRVQDMNDIGFYGTMKFEKPLGKSKNVYSLIPYTTGSVYSNPSENQKGKFQGSIGIDAKAPIGSSYMMDLTINPDYSSTDLTTGENNVTRFELKKPEKRQFFIDNADLFNGFGYGNSQAFYSRRVGIGTDTSNNTIIIPIIAGARFSGKINKDLRIGILDVQTKNSQEDLVPNNNNFVAAAEQRIFSKSTIGFIFVNRQAVNTNFDYNGADYNRVFGADFNFYSKDNSVSALAFGHRSFTPGLTGSQLSSGAEFNINKRKFNLRVTSQFVDEGFQSDIGYTERKDFVKINPFFEYRFYPKNDKILNQIAVNFYYNSFWKPSESMKNVEYNYNSETKWFFTEHEYVASIVGIKYVFLEQPFDPTNTPGGVPLPVGEYHFNEYNILFNTDRRRALAFNTAYNFGEFYSGKRSGIFVDARYRIQPFAVLGLIIEYDNIKLPEPHPSAKLWYLEPIMKITFTKNLFWSSQVQFSNQSRTMFVLSRIQWRYAPLSDIYLTYTDNFNTDPMISTGRGIYLKFTYWLDL